MPKPADKNPYDERFVSGIKQHLDTLYPEHAATVIDAVLEVVKKYAALITPNNMARWSERDVYVISYGNSIVDEGQKPLESLLAFLDEHLHGVINGVHILPFSPYSSDDGFSVIDYRQINPELGDWQHISNIAAEYKLMVDLVINHVSRESLWFYDYVANIEPAKDYFIDVPADTDVSQVTRPRNTPLLVPVNTHRGTRHVWATFSEDQIDLNFSNPAVLIEFIDILLLYLAKGSRVIRLDAIAFLWKELGTNCIHHPNTHEVVKLLRDIVDYLATDIVLLTETNVPHHENLSYFGTGDEAHMVYQFALPPLTLHAMNRGTSEYISQWVNELETIPAGCTYFNFTASHDGIGLRALEGLLPENEIESLIESMHQFGGFISMKANPDGVDTPYEINISYFDAMQGTRRGVDQWQVSRFICSQAIMLVMRGIPAFYIHSLLATPNYMHGVELTGRTRTINRKSWQLDELMPLLENPTTPNHEVFNALKKLIEVRSNEPCFNPDNPQQAIDAGYGVFVLLRTDMQSGQRLLAIHNVTHLPQKMTIKNQPEISDNARWYDLITQRELNIPLHQLSIEPYQVVWLLDKS